MKRPAVKSPCVDRCNLDTDKLLCTGCFRTLGEIAGWIDMDDEGRLAVIAKLARRQTVYELGKVGKKDVLF